MTTSSTHSGLIFESLVNHITLPPRLPGRQDTNLEEMEQNLTALLLNATNKLASGGDLDSLCRSLRMCEVVNAGRRLQRSTLLTAFRELQKGEFLLLHVVEQNAALVVRRDHEGRKQTVLFEAFEASPLSEEVLRSSSALQWDFPGSAVAIDIAEFQNPSFQEELAIFLEKASTESIKRFAARTDKAGSFASESRETVDPSLITQMLMTLLLQVNGNRVFPVLLRKRVRDDVCWDVAEIPWRRDPFWLLLRVAVHRHLSTALGSDVQVGRIQYKFLMCLVLAQLLNVSLPYLSLELLVHVKAKLCRRLVKLEVEKERASTNLRKVYGSLFEMLQPVFLKSTTAASERLDSDWAKFKKSIQRPVLALPQHADQRHLFLTLPNSGKYLREVLTIPLQRQRGFQTYKRLEDYDVSAAVTKQGTDFANQYFILSEMENEIECYVQAEQGHNDQSEDRCAKIAGKINEYLTTVANAYDFNPEQKSIMLLTVMELWMLLDETAVKLFPLLRDYSPGFPPHILDVLQLSRFEDMIRVHAIRAYLQKRNAACRDSYSTIFDDPTKGCFAERYYEESKDSLRLAELHQCIEDVAEQTKILKEKEWHEKCKEYDELARQIANTSCLYFEDQFQVKIHDERQCKKCFLERQKRRFSMQAYEHPLPEDYVQAKTVVFELGCPQALGIYRDTTWGIILILGLPTPVDGHEPLVILRDYSELKAFSHSARSRFSLASTTKSFLQTHYATPRFPLDLADVCLPNGLKFKYYDNFLKKWPGRQSLKVSFAHHCQITLPINSPFSSLQFSPEFAVDTHGFSSYQIVASATKCPAGLNAHEFMVFQTLFSGKTRRLPQVLVELGSANLNFSTEATALLLNLLALQVGPSHGANPLGAVHRVFHDVSFCQRLLDQLDQRLDTISSNYRETACMETIITFALRLSSLEVAVSADSAKLLGKIRMVTFRWLTVLRSEIQAATDAEISRRSSRYAFFSALLCRRTFMAYADHNKLLEPESLQCFIACSIGLQDNLVGDPAALPNLLRSSYIRDLRMVHRMRYILRQSLEASPNSLILSIAAVWPDAEGGPSRTFSRFEFLDKPNQWWVKVTIDPTPQTMLQEVHFNLLMGHLLVLGKPIGKLPPEHRTSAVLQQLFGNQSLLTYPSPLPGMTYMLAISIEGHRIHLGFRGGTLVVRVFVRNSVLELIPHEKFGNPLNFDLPASLVTNCVHWLNIQTGMMEIRQQSAPWKSKGSNWILDFNARSASRRTVKLVDPQSPLFSRVAQIFDKFEYRHHLTVYQPAKRPLSVELRRLELTFLVNERNLLESPQLQAEIITDQDAGFWYGLNSKIVMKEIVKYHDPYTRRWHSKPSRQKSVIVPIGDLIYKRCGPHVRVDIKNEGIYGRYTINDILKRLDCPSEPRLLYLKAQLHAYTSFVLPPSRAALEPRRLCIA